MRTRRPRTTAQPRRRTTVREIGPRPGSTRATEIGNRGAASSAGSTATSRAAPRAWREARGARRGFSSRLQVRLFRPLRNQRLEKAESLPGQPELFTRARAELENERDVRERAGDGGEKQPRVRVPATEVQ